MAQEAFSRTIERLGDILTELLAKTEPADLQNVTGTVTATAGTGTRLVTVLDAVGGDSCMDTVNNALRANIVAGGAGDGAIQDGVTSTIEATVFD